MSIATRKKTGNTTTLRALLAPLLALALLLSGCSSPAGEVPEPRVHWLHGFYTMDSDSQLDYACQMDAVSLGWARLEYYDGGALVNWDWVHDNDWIRPSNWRSTLETLRGASVACALNVYGTVSTFRALAQAGLLEEAAVALVRAAGDFDGLTVDIEGLRTQDREDFTALMTRLRRALPARQTLLVCVPPDTWYGGYDYRALGELCDRVILMAHDYQWTSVSPEQVGSTDTTTPLSPLSQVETALDHITDPQTGVRETGKVALQTAFNSCGLHVDGEGAILDTRLYHPATDTIARRLIQPDSVREWDERIGNPSLWYTTEDGSRYRLWYEDAQSVRARLTLAARYGITGVSLWRLGSIPDRRDIPHYDVWGLLTDPLLRPARGSSTPPAGWAP